MCLGAAMIDVLLYAFLAGIGVAIITGPLGAFIVWRRMAYFGDTLAHSSLLGVALGLLLAVNPTISVIVTCLIFALVLVVLQQQKNLASDTLLGILSHTSLAVGLIAIALMPDIRVDLLSLLFGDLLTVNASDVITIYVVSAIAMFLLVKLWNPLLADVLLYAFLAGIGVAIITGPLGAFIVWRRMAYFGDTLAHSSLLGVALGLLLAVNPTISVIVTCLIFALVLVVLQQQKNLASDTLLGILSHTSLAVGLIAIALMPDIRVDLLSLLFGDLLTVNASDVITIYVVSAIAMFLLVKLWNPLLAITIDEELAQVEGIRFKTVRIAFMLIIALEIAVAMKVVGVLLITALLIIPAATARIFSKTPEQMAFLASLVGCLAVILGLASSWYIDTPAGPSIVLSAGLLFLISLFKKNK